MQLRHNNDTSKRWYKGSKFVQTMVMNSNSIIILNPSDEKLHYISGSDVMVKYRHGKLIVRNTGQMSLALVFRVVQRYKQHNALNNTLITNIDNMAQKYKEKHMQR